MAPHPGVFEFEDKRAISLAEAFKLVEDGIPVRRGANAGEIGTGPHPPTSMGSGGLHDRYCTAPPL